MLATAPWWDAAWLSDLLLIAGFAVAGLIYGLTQHATTQQQRRSALNHLKGVKAAMRDWAGAYFDTDYEGAQAALRASEDYRTVLDGQYIQNFLVPITPVESLVQPPGDSWPLAPRTVEAAGTALHRMTIFNQLVQKQTDFHMLHAAEYQGDGPKEELARAVEVISRQLHGSAIGDRAWYRELVAALDENIEELEALLNQNPVKRLVRRRPWRRRPKPPENPPPQTGGRSGPS